MKFPVHLRPFCSVFPLAKLLCKLRSCARRRVPTLCQPIKDSPLSLLKWTAFFSPIRNGPPSNTVFRCKVVIRPSDLQILSRSQFFAFLENLSEHKILLVIHV